MNIVKIGTKSNIFFKSDNTDLSCHKKSMFLVFEGLDGSGKSTLMNTLNKALIEKGFSTVMTREPGGTELGDLLRKMILDPQSEHPVPRAELLMYEASRAQHVDKVIQPAIDNGKWVLCDRFTASSIAFQSGGRAIQYSEVEWLNRFATNQLEPQLTVLLDLTVEESEKRRSLRSMKTGESQDRIEQEKSDFHERVRQSFLLQASLDPEKWIVMNAGDSPEQLYLQLMNFLRDKKWL